MKLSLQLGILSIANIGAIFLFHWYILTQVGPGIETDAFFSSTALTQLVIMVISGSLMHVLVPLLAGEDKISSHNNAWGFLVLIGSLFGLLSALLYVAVPWLVPLMVPGFNEATRLLVVDLTRIQLIGMLFAAINGVQWATYHARQQFIWAEFTPVVASISTLFILVFALPRFGVVSAAWVLVFGAFLQTIMLAPGMGRPIRPDLKSVAIQIAWKRVKPLLLGTAYYKTDILVDRFLLSSAIGGNLSLYYLSQQIYGGVCQVLNKAIAAPLVPALSKIHKSEDRIEFRRIYQRKLLIVAAICLAVYLIFWLIGEFFLGLLIGYGNFRSSSVADLWWVMLWMGGVLIGGAVGQVCAATFYSCGDTKTPTQMSIVTYTLYLPCKISAFYYWGVKGMALVTSAYYVINLILQIILLGRKLK